MLQSYFSIGWRNLLRHKGYSLINIGGLAIGMAVAMLNALWIVHELNYNKSFDNYDHVAQITERGEDFERGGVWVGTTMTYPLGTTLREHYSGQFKRLARTSWDVDAIISAGENKFSAAGLFVDQEFPEIFSLKMLSGSRVALANTKSVLLSAKIARSLFGDEDPVNRVILLNNELELTVGGVFQDISQNAKFNNISFLAPWQQFLATNKWIEQRALTDWRNHFIKIYGEIPSNKSFEEVNAAITSSLQFDPQDVEKAKKAGQHLYLYPMSEWHLHPAGLRQGQFEPVVMLKLVGALGAFVLILACINFMNLSTARSEKRAREVGIRKTIGGIRRQLVVQFFSESILVVTFSFLIAIALTAAFLPTFNIIASKNMEMPLTESWFWLSGIGFVLITGLIAGSYPALYLSSFNPVKSLKGSFRAGRAAVLPRRVLVVFQFSISIILILGTAVVYQQIEFAKSRSVGYDREGLIMIQKRSADFNGKYEVLRSEWKNTGVVMEVSESMGPMTEIVSGNNGWDWEGRLPDFDPSFASLAVSHTHGKTAGWKFTMGRDFDLSNPTDSSAIVINESALKLMELKHPIGEAVTWTWWRDKAKMNYRIIGVVKDMVMDSPYAPAEPTIFFLKGFNGTPGWMNLRVNPNVSMHEALPKIEAVFKKVVPAVPFEYVFADEEFKRKFGKEERIGNLAFIFAILAVLISSLGLLGLASFVAEQRTKEIGIRKILGASVSQLWQTLSKDFVLLVVVSCVLSIPIAYWLLSKWLEKFAYHVNISFTTIFLISLGAVGLTLFTVSFQAIKTALINPVKNLRSE